MAKPVALVIATRMRRLAGTRVGSLSVANCDAHHHHLCAVRAARGCVAGRWSVGWRGGVWCVAMGSVGFPEVVVVLLVMLILLGPEQLPKAAQTMGKAVHEFRRITGGFDAEVRAVVQEVLGPLNQVAGGIPGLGSAFSGGVLGTILGGSGMSAGGAGVTQSSAGGPVHAGPGPVSAHSTVPGPVIPLDPSLN